MTPLLLLGVALGGGLGATVRFVLDGLVRERTSGAAPWGTITINLSGSLLLGVVTGLAAALALPEPAHLVLGVGVLGGYTTFSTASFETIRMLQERRWVAGLLNGPGVLVAAICLAGLGIRLGTLLV